MPSARAAGVAGRGAGLRAPAAGAHDADAWHRLARPFAPPTVTLKEIHAAVPKHLLRKNALRSTGYVLRDVFFCAAFFAFGAAIEPLVATRLWGLVPLTSPLWHAPTVRAAFWLTYWWWQGIAFTSFFCIGTSRAALMPTSARLCTSLLLCLASAPALQPTK